MKKVYFLRHGESLDDSLYLYPSPESDLSDLGRRQVMSAAKKIHKANISKIFSSKYKRAIQSAEIVAEYLNKEIITLDFIHEKEIPTELAHKSRHDIELQDFYKKYKEDWLSDDLDGKEGFTAFMKRIDKLIEFILSLPDNKNYLFVSHDVFIRALFFKVVLGESFNKDTFLSIYNNTRSEFASISEFVLENDTIVAKQLADSSHLRQLRTQKRVVSMGGGTGQYTLLKALKNLPIHISSLVSVADDGGSSGLLRDELGVLPPSDIRKCIVALSEAEPSLRKLFAYRFDNSSFKGHSLGNLILTALEKINNSSLKAIKEATEIFSCKGEVIPITEEPNMRLEIELKNQKILSGEHMLDDNTEIRHHGVKRVFLKESVSISDLARQEIEKAEYIIIGPGDLYGSILPNFLVSGVPEAIRNSSAKIIYVANLTNKKGQTEYFSVCDYLKILRDYMGKDIDFVLCNSADIDKELLDRYIRQEGEGARVACSFCRFSKAKFIKRDLLSSLIIEPEKGDTLASSRSYIRHDPNKLASAISQILNVAK